VRAGIQDNIGEMLSKFKNFSDYKIKRR